MKLTIILEKGEQIIWGRIDSIPNFLPTTFGQNIQEITNNLKLLIADHYTHEKNPFFHHIAVDEIEFDYAYDVSAFFAEFDAVKINSIAKKAGLNQGLVRQYVAGIKHPSKQQVEKIQTAVHELGKQLIEVQLC
jgi:hypothetical protein